MLRLLAFVALLATGACHGVGTRGGAEACKPIEFEGSHFTICAAKPGKHRLLLAAAGADGQPLRDFDRLEGALGPDKERVAFAMNAGMFDKESRPIGLYVENGREIRPLNRRAGPGNFHMKPNGVFYVDHAGWHVADTDAFADSRHDGLRFATQSGPMLVINGELHPGFADNGTSLQTRNGVGVSLDGTAWFVISDEPVSFGRFARLFRDKLTCPDALYFDGFVSRLWDPPGRRRDAGVAIGPIVVALQSR